MKKISEILLEYKTDKNMGTIDPKLGHTYGVVYDEIFSHFNKDGELEILEIGVQKGGSLKAWKDFFSNSLITGCDIAYEVLPEYKMNDAVYVINDIKNVSLNQTRGLDIVIDDGSHFLGDVLWVVKEYLPKLRKGGVLIIEDCQNPEGWLNEITKLSTGYRIQTFDLRPPYDNYIITIWNDDNN